MFLSSMIPLPQKPKIILKQGNRVVFEIEGLYPGYGMTLGNALRRVLLSSLPGAAMTTVKIKGVAHEFSTIPYILEDVVDIILNLKQLRFKLHSDEPQKVSLKVKGEKEVKALDLRCPSQVEVVNKDAHIATLTNKKAELEIEITIEKGMGYEPVEAREKEKLAVGTIAVDAIYTPIRKVNYEVENMRVGKRTDYNKLRFHIETDGTIVPEEALEKSAAILVEQFSTILGLTSKPKIKKSSAEKISVALKTSKEETKKIKIEELKLSTRTINAILQAGVKTAGALSKKSKDDLVSLERLGEKGVKEIEKALNKVGLELKE